MPGSSPDSDCYVLTRRVFLTWLGAVYLFAFGSLWLQIDGLVGSDGIMPVTEYLDLAFSRRGRFIYFRVPTLLWLDSSDRAIDLVCHFGVVSSVCVILGLRPRLALFGCWLFYLSLISVGSVFLSFQWDALLLEAGLLAILFAPPAHRGRTQWQVQPSRAVLLLYRLLIFRLFFFSGWLKLRSGDVNWLSLRALDFHYETQPIPVWLSWYAHQLPAFVHTASVAATLAIELAVPFLVFGPRRARHFACAALVLLQIAIAATGNYGFFNLLSVGLCLLLLDDGILRALLPGRVGGAWLTGIAPRDPRGVTARAIGGVVAGVVIASIFVVVIIQLAAQSFAPFAKSPLAARIQHHVTPFRSVNRYGLFSVMTTERREIVLEGSRDGRNWKTYDFHWKPGAVDRRPAFIGPHMPRLDWRMWFASMRSCNRTLWFKMFMNSLLMDQRPVSDLLAHDPFRDGKGPPAYLRSTLYRYRFSDPSSGETDWWTRELIGEHCGVVEGRRGRLRAIPALPPEPAEPRTNKSSDEVEPPVQPEPDESPGPGS
jgi:hypothetical protein